MANAQGRAEKAFPEAFVDHQSGNERSQQRQAEKRHQVPAPAVAIGEWHQPPAVQRPGEGAEVELRRDTLDHAAVRIDINHHRAPVGVADFDIQGEMRLVGAADALHHGLRFGLVDGLDDLLITE
ncbi:hypothetical protein D3C84_475680 [compost metagenome]